METENFLKSKAAKILLPMIVVLGLITILKFGYMFGQWLHHILN